MESVFQFAQSVAGRTIRVIVGIILLALGLFVMHAGFWGIVVALIGLLALVQGALGVILVAPLFGYTLTGQKRAGPVGL